MKLSKIINDDASQNANGNSSQAANGNSPQAANGNSSQAAKETSSPATNGNSSQIVVERLFQLAAERSLRITAKIVPIEDTQKPSSPVEPRLPHFTPIDQPSSTPSPPSLPRFNISSSSSLPIPNYPIPPNADRPLPPRSDTENFSFSRSPTVPPRHPPRPSDKPSFRIFPPGPLPSVPMTDTATDPDATESEPDPCEHQAEVKHDRRNIEQSMSTEKTPKRLPVNISRSLKKTKSRLSNVRSRLRRQQRPLSDVDRKMLESFHRAVYYHLEVVKLKQKHRFIRLKDRVMFLDKLLFPANMDGAHLDKPETKPFVGIRPSTGDNSYFTTLLRWFPTPGPGKEHQDTRIRPLSRPLASRTLFDFRSIECWRLGNPAPFAMYRPYFCKLEPFLRFLRAMTPAKKNQLHSIYNTATSTRFNAVTFLNHDQGPFEAA